MIGWITEIKKVEGNIDNTIRIVLEIPENICDKNLHIGDVEVRQDYEDVAAEKGSCEHKTVLEIYKDEDHTQVSHYRCMRCGEKRNERFGEKVIDYDLKGGR